MKRIFDFLKSPPGYVYIIAYLLTLLSGTASICLITIDGIPDNIAPLMYGVFAIAAISLSYSVYLTVISIGRFKGRILEIMNRFFITRRMLESYGFRTVFFAIGGFIIVVVFAGINIYAAIKAGSVWYGALAGYYVFLGLARGGILYYYRGAISGRSKEEGVSTELHQATLFRRTGVILLVLNVALSSAIAQMIFDDRGFIYMGWLIYAYAAYAFYKITMSIINLVKATRQDELNVIAIRCINILDAAVSILALQTAMLFTFSTGDIDASLLNTITGTAVSITSFAIGIYMVVKGNRKIRELKGEHYGEG